MQYYPFLTMTSTTPSPTLPHLVHPTFPTLPHLLHSRISYIPAFPTPTHFLRPRISYHPTSPTSPHLLRTSRHVIHLRSYTPPSLHLRLPPSPTHRLASLPFSQPPSSPNFQAQPFTAAAITQWVTLRITPPFVYSYRLPTHPPSNHQEPLAAAARMCLDGNTPYHLDGLSGVLDGATPRTLRVVSFRRTFRSSRWYHSHELLRIVSSRWTLWSSRWYHSHELLQAVSSR